MGLNTVLSLNFMILLGWWGNLYLPSLHILTPMSPGIKYSSSLISSITDENVWPCFRWGWLLEEFFNSEEKQSIFSVMEGVRRVMLTSSFWPGWLKERSDLISDFLPGRWLQRADIYGHCNCLALSHNNEGIFHAHADQGGRHFYELPGAVEVI